MLLSMQNSYDSLSTVSSSSLYFCSAQHALMNRKARQIFFSLSRNLVRILVNIIRI